MSEPPSSGRKRPPASARQRHAADKRPARAARWLGLAAVACVLLVLIIAPLAYWAATAADERARKAEEQKRQVENPPLKAAEGQKKAQSQDVPEKTPPLLYGQTMRRVQEALDAGQLKEASALLNRFDVPGKRPGPRGWEWYYFDARLREATGKFDPPFRNLHDGKNSPVFRIESSSPLAWSPDSRRIAGLVAAGSVAVWKAEGGKPLCRVGGPARAFAHLLGVAAAAWSPDGKRLALAGVSGQVELWDASGKEVVALGSHNEPATALAWSPDGKLLTSASGQRIKLWDVAAGKEAPGLTHDGDFVMTSVLWSPDGRRLAAGGHGGVRLWDVETGAEVLRLPAVDREDVVAWRPGGKQILTTASDRTRVLDAAGGQEEFVLPGGGHGGVGAWSPDGRRLAAALPGGTLVLDAQTGEEQLKLRPDAFGRSPPGHVDWSRDGKDLILTAHDVNWLVDAATGRVLQLRTPGAPLLVSPDRRHAVRVVDRAASIWDLQDGKQLRSLGAAMGGDITCVVWGRDPRRFVTGSKDGTVRFHDADTGQTMHELPGSREQLHALEFSRDGKRLAALTGAGTVTVWSGDGRKVLASWSAAPVKVKAGKMSPAPVTLAWSPDGERLALGTPDGISVRSALTGKVERPLDAEGRVLAWSPDDSRLACLRSNADRLMVQVRDVATGNVLHTIRHSDDLLPNDWRYGPAARPMAWSPDGRRLAVAGLVGQVALLQGRAQVAIWDPESGESLAVLKGMPARGLISWMRFHVAWSPDGWKLACHVTGSPQVGPIVVWDVTPPST